MGVPYAPTYANGHISATGDPIHFMFGSMGRVFGDGGSNGDIYSSNKSKMAAAAILEKFQMAISPPRLTIYLYSAHRAVIFAIAQLSCIKMSSQIRAILRLWTQWSDHLLEHNDGFITLYTNISKPSVNNRNVTCTMKWIIPSTQKWDYRLSTKHQTESIVKRSTSTEDLRCWLATCNIGLPNTCLLAIRTFDQGWNCWGLGVQPPVDVYRRSFLR